MKKRLLALLLCAAMLLALLGCTTASAKSVDLMQGVEPLPVEPEGAFSREGAAAITRFGLQLLGGTLDGEGSNAMVSPLSVISALAMTAQGAKGETLEEMEQVFGLELDELRRWLLAFRATLPDEEGCKLSLANAIWFKDTPSFAVNQEFLQTNASWYGADLYKAPFNDTTQKEINRWVEENTDGMIRNILDRIPESAVMYLVNALAFDGEWASIYNEGQIRESTFTTEAGEVQPVEMMYNKENRYLETDCATGFIKRYKGGQYAFAALLPKAGYTVADCASLLQGMALEELLIHPSQEPVHTGLPKFESEYTVELSGRSEERRVGKECRSRWSPYH